MYVYLKPLSLAKISLKHCGGFIAEGNYLSNSLNMIIRDIHFNFLHNILILLLPLRLATANFFCYERKIR